MSQLSPVSGDAFIFFGKRRGGVKILKWDGDGFLLSASSFEGGTFELPTLNLHTGHYEVPYTTSSSVSTQQMLVNLARQESVQVALAA